MKPGRLDAPAGARRAQATTEYMVLISVIVIAIVAAGFLFRGIFRKGVGNLAMDVEELLGGDPDRPAESSSDCPYVFDPRTGRWHDPDHSYLMVSFDDAHAAGCSR